MLNAMTDKSLLQSSGGGRAGAGAGAGADGGDGGLPASLSSNPLFIAQRIPEEGFGLCWEEREGAPRLRFSMLREAATRKTLMPTILKMSEAERVS